LSLYYEQWKKKGSRGERGSPVKRFEIEVEGHDKARGKSGRDGPFREVYFRPRGGGKGER